MTLAAWLTKSQHLPSKLLFRSHSPWIRLVTPGRIYLFSLILLTSYGIFIYLSASECIRLGTTAQSWRIMESQVKD